MPKHPTLGNALSPATEMDAAPNTLPRRQWLVSVVVICAITVTSTAPSLLDGREPARVLPLLVHCLLELPILMAVLSVAFRWGIRHRFSTARLLGVSLAIAAAIGTVSVLAIEMVATYYPSLRPPMPPRNVAQLAAFGSMLGMFHCGIWALAFLLPHVAESARVVAAEAEQMRTAAELARLRAQLEPHFLLNTLNTIAGLVTEDARKARRLIACLGDLLRDSLRTPDEWSTVRDEVAWLRRYAEILESRHAGVLTFEWHVADETIDMAIPRLLLQPLVENAVKHGALARRGRGRVVLRTSLLVEGDEAPRMVCVIEDNGPGVSRTAPRKDAFGLKSVRRRLELRWPGASLRLESSSEGTRSILDLPRRAMEKA